MKTAPTNMDDVIDSRDIIERIEELENELPASANEVMPNTAEELQEMREELAILKALAEKCEGYAPDWSYVKTLIRDSYFQDYAQELAVDCCEMPNSDQWPARCIDWEQAARELIMDYTCVDFDGVEYWIRCY